MDGLSGAASVMAVVSLPLQLAESAKLLWGFWDSIQEAPQDIQDIAKRLKLLSTVLERIGAYENQHGRDSAVTELLDCCSDQIRALRNITNDFQCGIASAGRLGRKWAAVKISFKKDRIEKFQAILQETNVILILAQQNMMTQTIQGQHYTTQRSLSTIIQAIEQVKAHRSSHIGITTSPPGSTMSDHIEAVSASIRVHSSNMASSIQNPIYRAGFEMGCSSAIRQILETLPESLNVDESNRRHNSEIPGAHAESLDGTKRQRKRRRLVQGYQTTNHNMFCNVHFASRVYHITTPDLSCIVEYSSAYRVYPSWWLAKLGLNRGLDLLVSRASQGWQYSLKVFYRVPDNSMIFDYVRTGNIEGVKALLADGKASVWDINSLEATPLHIAVQSCNAELCGILLNVGADPHALAATPFDQSCSESPLLYINYADGSTNTTARLATIALFREYWDLTEPNNIFLLLMSMFFRHFKHPSDRSMETSLGAIELVISDVRACLDRFEAYVLLCIAMVFFEESPPELTNSILDITRGFIDTLWEPDGYTMLHISVARCSNFTGQLIENGADLHLVGQNNWHSFQSETPTSIALMSSFAFFRWRKFLKEAGRGLKTFVQNEMKAGVLVENGWKETTLLELFCLDFEPLEMGRNCCDACGIFFFFGGEIIVEPRWYTFIEEIKTGGYRGSEGVVEEPAGDPDRCLPEEGIAAETNKSVDDRDNKCCQSERGEDRYQVPAESLEGAISGGKQKDILWNGELENDDEEEEEEEDEESDYEESNTLLCWHCWYKGVKVGSKNKTMEQLSDSDELSDYEDSPLLLSL